MLLFNAPRDMPCWLLSALRADGVTAALLFLFVACTRGLGRYPCLEPTRCPFGGDGALLCKRAELPQSKIIFADVQAELDVQVLYSTMTIVSTAWHSAFTHMSHSYTNSVVAYQRKHPRSFIRVWALEAMCCTALRQKRSACFKSHRAYLFWHTILNKGEHWQLRSLHKQLLSLQPSLGS